MFKAFGVNPSDSVSAKALTERGGSFGQIP